MTHTAPVSDWATDFDVMDPQYLADPFSIWDQLRRTCPIPHTDRRKSSWMPLRYEDVTAIAHDIEHFSSLKVAVIPGDEDEDPNANFDGPNLEYGLPPISADPPLHTWTRRLLLPWFSHNAGGLLRAADARALPGAARRLRRQGPRRRRGRLRPADPGAGDRPHPRRLDRPGRHVHRVGARRARVRRRPGAPPGRAPRGCSTTSSSSWRSARRTRATTCSASCCTPRWTASRSTTASSWAWRRSCSSPASTRRGAPSARRCGTWPRTRRTASAWWPSPS